MPRMLHIGVGNFHRAHQAAYTADALGDWKITGIVMGNVALFERMKDGAGYSLGIRGAGGMRTQRIVLHDKMILARNDPQAVVDAFVDSDVQIVTLTITEKGYCLDASAGDLDLFNPSIKADLNGAPKSAIGLLVHGLAKRAAAGLPPITIISCDNLSENGKKLAAAVAKFSDAASLTLDPRNCFPNTMVDRITPATADVAAPIITEDFSEWVIEDIFAGPRPDWAAAGVEYTLDVAPFEMRKLRLLNAAHSWLAYAGQLGGHVFVHQAMADKALSEAVDRLWDEAQTTLPVVVQASTPDYRSALIDRFAVVEMRHELSQIGADGSLKLRERIVPLINEMSVSPQATQAVAAWIAFVNRKIRTGGALADPNEERIRQIVQTASDASETCKPLAEMIGVEKLTEGWIAELSYQVGEFSNQPGL